MNRLPSALLISRAPRLSPPLSALGRCVLLCGLLGVGAGLGAGFSTRSNAVELGSLQVLSGLGQPFVGRIPFTLAAGETIDARCVRIDSRISTGPSGELPGLPRASVEVARGVLVVRTGAPVNEPAVRIPVVIDCSGTTSRREFMALLDERQQAAPAPTAGNASVGELPKTASELRKEKREEAKAARAAEKLAAKTAAADAKTAEKAPEKPADTVALRGKADPATEPGVVGKGKRGVVQNQEAPTDVTTAVQAAAQSLKLLTPPPGLVAVGSVPPANAKLNLRATPTLTDRPASDGERALLREEARLRFEGKNADDIATALNAFKTRATPTPAAAPTVEQAPALVAVPTPPPPTAPPTKAPLVAPKPPVKPTPTKVGFGMEWIVSGIAGLVALGAAAWLWLRRRPHPSKRQERRRAFSFDEPRSDTNPVTRTEPAKTAARDVPVPTPVVATPMPVPVPTRLEPAVLVVPTAPAATPKEPSLPRSAPTRAPRVPEPIAVAPKPSEPAPVPVPASATPARTTGAPSRAPRKPQIEANRPPTLPDMPVEPPAKLVIPTPTTSPAPALPVLAPVAAAAGTVGALEFEAGLAPVKPFVMPAPPVAPVPTTTFDKTIILPHGFAGATDAKPAPPPTPALAPTPKPITVSSEPSPLAFPKAASAFTPDDNEYQKTVVLPRGFAAAAAAATVPPTAPALRFGADEDKTVIMPKGVAAPAPAPLVLDKLDELDSAAPLNLDEGLAFDLSNAGDAALDTIPAPAPLTLDLDKFTVVLDKPIFFDLDAPTNVVNEPVAPVVVPKPFSSRDPISAFTRTLSANESATPAEPAAPAPVPAPVPIASPNIEGGNGFSLDDPFSDFAKTFALPKSTQAPTQAPSAPSKPVAAPTVTAPPANNFAQEDPFSAFTRTLGGAQGIPAADLAKTGRLQRLETNVPPPAPFMAGFTNVFAPLPASQAGQVVDNTKRATMYRKEFVYARFPEVAAGHLELSNEAEVRRVARVYYQDDLNPTKAIELIELALQENQEQKKLWLVLIELFRLEKMSVEYTDAALKYKKRFGEEKHFWPRIAADGYRLNPTCKEFVPFAAEAGKYDDEESPWLGSTLDMTGAVLGGELRKALATPDAVRISLFHEL